MKLRHKLSALVDDLATVEASLEQDGVAVAYSRLELEGDTVSWIAGDGRASRDALVQLHQTQLIAAGECRAALITLSTTILGSLVG